MSATSVIVVLVVFAFTTTFVQSSSRPIRIRRDAKAFLNSDVLSRENEIDIDTPPEKPTELLRIKKSMGKEDSELSLQDLKDYVSEKDDNKTTPKKIEQRSSQMTLKDVEGNAEENFDKDVKEVDRTRRQYPSWRNPFADPALAMGGLMNNNNLYRSANGRTFTEMQAQPHSGPYSGFPPNANSRTDGQAGTSNTTSEQNPPGNQPLSPIYYYPTSPVYSPHGPGGYQPIPIVPFPGNSNTTQVIPYGAGYPPGSASYPPYSPYSPYGGYNKPPIYVTPPSPHPPVPTTYIQNYPPYQPYQPYKPYQPYQPYQPYNPYPYGSIPPSHPGQPGLYPPPSVNPHPPVQTYPGPQPYNTGTYPSHQPYNTGSYPPSPPSYPSHQPYNTGSYPPSPPSYNTGSYPSPQPYNTGSYPSPPTSVPLLCTCFAATKSSEKSASDENLSSYLFRGSRSRERHADGDNLATVCSMDNLKYHTLNKNVLEGLLNIEESRLKQIEECMKNHRLSTQQNYELHTMVKNDINTLQNEVKLMQAHKPMEAVKS